MVTPLDKKNRDHQLVELRTALLDNIQSLTLPLNEKQRSVLQELHAALEQKIIAPELAKNHALTEDRRLQEQVSKGKVSDDNSSKPEGPKGP